MPLDAAPPLDPLPQSAIGQFFHGAAYPLRALLLIRRERLWRLAAVPVLLHLLLLSVALYALDSRLMPGLTQRYLALHARLQPPAEYLETVRVLWQIGYVLVWVVLLPILGAIAALVLMAIGQFFSGPWLDLLAERVEGLVLERSPKPWTWRRGFEGLLAGLADLFVGPLYLFLIYLPVVLLWLLPIVGGISSLLCGALLVAHQSFAPTLGRAWLSYRARWQAVLRNRWMCAGFGTVCLLLFWLPLLGQLILPVVTVGGTLLCCDLLRAGRIRPAQ